MTTLHNSGNSIDLEKLAPDLLVIIVNIIVIVNFIASINMIIIVVRSDRSSCTDDGLLYIRAAQLFQIFTQSLEAIDVTSVTQSCLNSINAIEVTRC